MADNKNYKEPKSAYEWIQYNRDPVAWKKEHRPAKDKLIDFIKALPLYILSFFLLWFVLPALSGMIFNGIDKSVSEIFQKTPTIARFQAVSTDSSTDIGCPDGCTYYKDGCDIKGNISYNTREKIYHLPGQEFYDNTTINPDYGERWFCTEEEAIDNGWRKSYQ
jgi:hypothetical protein